jgi:hypothetical protein
MISAGTAGRSSVFFFFSFPFRIAEGYGTAAAAAARGRRRHSTIALRCVALQQEIQGSGDGGEEEKRIVMKGRKQRRT